MREACVDSLVGYIDLINGFEDRAACFRGAKDPVDDMRPTVVRSWRRNRQLRAEQGENGARHSSMSPSGARGSEARRSPTSRLRRSVASKSTA